jgi:succinoglycan biosynthesis protein ExoM
MRNKHHISVCICTYKRPELLRQLLSKLENQETEDRFDFSVVIADNDKSESARATVESFARKSRTLVHYHVEPEQNIALARNMTVRHAAGDFVAFIDDDESPIKEWLLRMHAALSKYGTDGVLGPVKPLFETAPPPWIIKAGLFERPNSQCYQTGLVLDWRQTGTGNVLVKRGVLNEVAGPFNGEFGSGGEDFDFFRRAMALNKVFVWCEEATVYETVPIERTRLSFQLRRALLRGKASLTSPAGNALGIARSFAACAVYTMMLPVCLIMGRHVFVKYLVSACDHFGKLLAACGIEVVKEKYILK